MRGCWLISCFHIMYAVRNKKPEACTSYEPRLTHTVNFMFLTFPIHSVNQFPVEHLLMGSCSTINLAIIFCFAQEDTYTGTTGILWAVLNSLGKLQCHACMFLFLCFPNTGQLEKFEYCNLKCLPWALFFFVAAAGKWLTLRKL